ncbi:hypothetical protein NOS3756_05760 [Nostoc sp. NIES-3756]|uniref:hypothetical protein n=1 Tax=Nostoc sp. NIES-3756 TaxID=1751286 RepID=UPI000721C9E1|nr:hypothetical protein [Nostoc sp. NIES-3756]BAT51649.1 hypothetical protein NOS3756_05760 [Nostoc sp. NIES-3756]
MPNHRYPSPYWRYFRARLSNLGKPSFWGTAIFLSVVGLFVHQYWTNPQIANNPNIENTNADDSELSEEDKAIAADIDNLPSLFADTEPFISPANTTQSQKNKNKTPSTITNNKPSSGDRPKLNSDSGIANFQQPTSVDKNIFVSEAENLLRFGATNNDQLLGYKPGNGSSPTTGEIVNSALLKTGLPNQVNTSQNVNSNNLLPTGVTSSTNQASSVNNNSPYITNSTNITTYGGVTQSLPTTIQAPQTFSPSTGLNSGLGYIQPSYTNNLNNVQTVPINTRVSPVTSYTQPSYTNNLNNDQLITPNTRINSGVGYVQPIIPNPPNNVNYLQNSPNQTQSTSTVITGTSSIIGPYTVRSRRANTTTNTTPVVPNNYGYSQIPQANFPNNNLPQGQNTNGFQNNGYSYP